MKTICSRLGVGIILLLLMGTVDIELIAARSNLVCIVVHADLYDQIKPFIDRYVLDIENEGFETELRLFRGGTAEDVRAMLNSTSLENLVGAVLVGDIPGAIYEIWWDNRSAYVEFSCDLFYMDLDGIFSDTDGNGKYDLHTGNRTPEIWIGRIKASNMSESEVSLVERYFNKNHDYRTGILKLPDRALIYIDDDWSQYNSSIDADVGLVFSDRTLIAENVTTSASDYLERLSQNWSLVQLAVHGTPTTHDFQTNGQNAGIIDYRNISATNYRCFFYNLFSCWNGQYTSKDYLAGWYLFSDDCGVAVVCSAKDGGMWFFSDFYANFKNNTLGFSFRKWLEKQVLAEDQYPDTWYSKTWYYGMEILGDPTLTLRMTTLAYRTDLNKDGTVNIQDITLVAIAFGSKPGDPNWNQAADLNRDGVIDIIDITMVAIDYGKTI